MKTCKVCKIEKEDTEFQKNRHGLTNTCKSCRKPSTRVVKPKWNKNYRPPNGQGGKYSFNFDKLLLNTPEANYIYGLIVALGYNNPNVSVYNRSNVMIVSSNKKIIKQICEFVEMDIEGVYELPRAEEKKERSKWGMIMYHSDILPVFDKMKSYRRQDTKRGLLVGEGLK